MFIVDTANLLLFIKTTKYLPPFTNLPPFIVGVFSYLLSLIDNKNRPFYLQWLARGEIMQFQNFSFD